MLLNRTRYFFIIPQCHHQSLVGCYLHHLLHPIVMRYVQNTDVTWKHLNIVCKPYVMSIFIMTSSKHFFCIKISLSLHCVFTFRGFSAFLFVFASWRQCCLATYIFSIYEKDINVENLCINHSNMKKNCAYKIMKSIIIII